MTRLKLSPRERAAAERLDDLYARLPALDCKGLCQESCGPVLMSRVEWFRIIERLDHEPQATSLTCPMLTDDGKCSVYDVRPLICRLWGMVERMRCPHGCAPERWLSDEDAYALLAEAAEVGEARLKAGAL